MKNVARLAYFTIRFIEKFEIDPFQGAGGKPQFWCIPNNAPLFSDSDKPEWITQFEQDANVMLDNFNLKNIDALMYND
jgi:hypothetical protein